MNASVWLSFVLVHGNFLGPWSWERVAETLRARGAHVVTPDLPSAAGDSAPSDLYADARVVRDALDGMPELLSSGFTATNPLTVELPTGHCPNWSVPDDVAELLLAEGGRV